MAKQVANVNNIHGAILDGISNDYQKTQGFPTYDLTRGIAIGIEELENIAYDTAYKQDVDNLEGDGLENFIVQRTGQTRTKSVKAVGEITIVNGQGSILEGDLFATELGVQFESTETKYVKQGDKVSIRATNGGSTGNVPQNSIILTPVTIQGISEITNEENTHGGYDEETDDALRARYYELLRTPVNGVNANTYIVRAKEVDGVIGARCIPIWNGKNTVKVIIIGNDYKPADEELINDVQNYIDPNKNGDGSGTAPIGAVTTVVGATPTNINITIKGLQIEAGNDINTVKRDIHDRLDRYIKSTVFNTDYISVAKCSSEIISTNGVKDYSNLLLNGGHSSIIMQNDECGVLNEVIYSD